MRGSRTCGSFNPRATTNGRATRTAPNAPTQASAFQSTRDHEWPRDADSTRDQVRFDVSIHARPRMAARRFAAGAKPESFPFQSTRDHEWPRDPCSGHWQRALRRFNPRATTNGRATPPPSLLRPRGRVSIHARPRMAARPGHLSTWRVVDLFQSTRDHEWPRDLRGKGNLTEDQGFNPRATTNGRATALHSRGIRPYAFQSTRDHEWPRDAWRSARRLATRCFNPRATTNGRATRVDAHHVLAAHEFQSTRDHEWPRDQDGPGQARMLYTFQSTRDHEWPRDTAGVRPRAGWFSFQSTRDHEWPRDLPRHVLRGGDVVSIHARPRMAARRRNQLGNRCCDVVSIHARPRMAARPSVATTSTGLFTFQSTRDHEWPRDRAGGVVGPACTVSIHARPRMAARRGSVAIDDGGDRVSIHARPRMAARLIAPPPCVADTWFQSTRDHEWPRDHRTMQRAPRRQRFNPRATTNGRATPGELPRGAHCDVSIHARPRMAARQDGPGQAQLLYTFQSTRDHEWPRDAPAWSTNTPPSCFNPRATTNGRATEIEGVITSGRMVSIHARPRMAARQHYAVRDFAEFLVSIHARPRMAARHGTHARDARGPVCFNPRATTNGRATTVDCDAAQLVAVSIHARPRMAARLYTCARSDTTCPCFNPRATTNGRATVALCGVTKLEVVSIHARPRMAARHTSPVAIPEGGGVSIHARPRMAARQRAAPVLPDDRSFQSTRDHEWPRDRPPQPQHLHRQCFNPRATTNGRATAVRGLIA